MATYNNTELGISLEYPDTWRVKSLLDMADFRTRMAQGADDALAQMMLRAQLPLLALFKHDDDHDDVNPSIQLTARRFAEVPPGLNAKAVAMAVFTAVQQLPQAKLEVLEETTVDGFDAAKSTVSYTVMNHVGTFPVRSHSLTIMRGDICLQLGLAGKQSGPDACEAEFARVLESVHIDA